MLAEINICPEEYQEKFRELLKEKTTKLALPKHQLWDHEISLKPGAKPKFMSIYQLSEKEQEVLQKYLKEYLKKRFIRLSTSSAEYLILFASKPREKLKLYVD